MGSRDALACIPLGKRPGQARLYGIARPTSRTGPIRPRAYCFCSFTRETICVGLTKRSAMSTHTRVIAM
jgi:hypothetical protein